MNTTIDLLVEKKLHLGHPTRDWNPRMAPYIYTKRNGFYIIDLISTYSALERTKNALYNAAFKGNTFLFVGTKQQASNYIKQYAEDCGCFYIASKWSGGLLTNWRTVSGMIQKLNSMNQQKNTVDKRFSTLSKKQASNFEKQRLKLEQTVGGIQNMKKLPDIAIIIGAHEESNAVKECNKLGIPIVSILDTNCDPKTITWGVPGNDDSTAAIDFILQQFAEAIRAGKEQSFSFKEKIKR